MSNRLSPSDRLLDLSLAKPAAGVHRAWCAKVRSILTEIPDSARKRDVDSRLEMFLRTYDTGTHRFLMEAIDRLRVWCEGYEAAHAESAE